MVKRLNSTGSLWLNDEGYVFSYDTQLTAYYNDLKIFNNTFYSMTTRKHQSQFNKKDFDLILNYCSFRTRLQPTEIERAIKLELEFLDDKLLELSKKRNTNKKAATIKNISSRKAELIAVLN